MLFPYNRWGGLMDGKLIRRQLIGEIQKFLLDCEEQLKDLEEFRESTKDNKKLLIESYQIQVNVMEQMLIWQNKLLKYAIYDCKKNLGN